MSFYIKVLLPQLSAGCLKEMQMFDDLQLSAVNLNALIEKDLDTNILWWTPFFLALPLTKWNQEAPKLK